MSFAVMRTEIYLILCLKIISSLSTDSTTELPFSEFKCPITVENATASSNCSRYENTTCKFECNSGYARTSDGVNMTLLCTLDGWESTIQLCKVYQCDGEYNNATASQNCSRHDNTSCEFVCNYGYRKATNDSNMNLTCTPQGWDDAGILCINDFQCGTDYGHASVSDNCTRLENTTCEFHCNSGYVQSHSTDNMTLTCTREAGWIGQYDLCIRGVDNGTDVIKTKPPLKNSVVLSVAIAVGAFVLIVALVVIITLMQKRRIKNHIASFSNVAVRFTTASVGIDNPAYKAEMNGYSDSRAIIEEEAEGEEIQDRTNRDSPDAARKYSTSRYSLTGIEGIDLDMDDSAVLTSESWQREKNVFPEHLQ